MRDNLCVGVFGQFVRVTFAIVSVCIAEFKSQVIDMDCSHIAVIFEQRCKMGGDVNHVFGWGAV